MGAIILIAFLLVKIYILTFFRETNPFSDMQHAGETIYRGIFIFIIKILFSLYSILDMKGEMESSADILFTVILLLIIAQSHYEIGLFKSFPRLLEIKLMYFTLCIGILQSTDCYSNAELTSFTYVISYFILSHFVSDWIIAWQRKRAILVDLVTNHSPEKLEIHVLALIELIDAIDRRENRIELEGYLHIHRR
jgi:hypothetical protein